MDVCIKCESRVECFTLDERQKGERLYCQECIEQIETGEINMNASKQLLILSKNLDRELEWCRTLLFDVVKNLKFDMDCGRSITTEELDGYLTDINTVINKLDAQISDR